MIFRLALAFSFSLLALPLLAQRASAVYVFTSTARPIAGDPVSVEVMAIDANSNPLGNISPVWTTNNAAVAEFRQGQIITKSPGMVDLAVTVLGARGLLRLQVLPARIEISPGNSKIELGQPVDYSAIVFDSQGAPIPNVTLRWDVVSLDGGTNNGVSIPRSGGQLNSSGVGRFRVRASIDYPSAGPGQFTAVFTSAVELSVEPKRYFRTNVLLPSQFRVGGFRLTPRSSRLSMNENGDLAFLASTEGLGTAVVRARGKTLELAAISGESMVRPGTVVTDFDDAFINSSGEILAAAAHSGADVFSSARSLYFVSRPGLARGATLAGLIASGADAINNFRLGRHSYNNQSHYAYAGNFSLPGTRTARTGIFLGDGSFDERIFISSDTLPGLRSPLTFPQELVIDDQDNIWFVAIDSDNRPALCYRSAALGTVQVLVSQAQPLNGYKPVQIDSLVSSPSGTVAFRLRDASLGWIAAVFNKPDPASARTRELPGDNRALFDVNAKGDILFYGNPGQGTGLYFWPLSGAPRAIALLQRAAPNGEVYADFRAAAMNTKGDIAFAARTSGSMYLVVRDNGGRDELIFPQEQLRFPDALRLSFPGFISGSRSASPLVVAGGSQAGLVELSARGPRVVMSPDMPLPSGQFFGDINTYVAQPDASILIPAAAGVFRFNSTSMDTVGPGNTNITGGIQYSAFRLAANSSGAFLSVHGSSVGVNRLNLNVNGQSRNLGNFGNTSDPAYRTPAPTGGYFVAIANIDLDDVGVAYVVATTSNGLSGLFTCNGGVWQPLVILNQTQIDGRPVREITTWDVGADRVFALLKFDGGRSSISECQIDSCRTRFDQLSDLPLGGTVSVFNLLSANRKNEFAFSYFGGGGEVVAIASPGQPARMVLNKSEPLAAGEWIITLNKIQLQDSGRLLLSVFTTNDNFAILEAEPLN